MALVVKNPPANAGDVRVMGLIPGSGRFPEGGHSTHAWRILADREAWQATVHRDAQSQTQLKQFSTYKYVY